MSVHESPEEPDVGITSDERSAAAPSPDCVRQHLRFGWWSLLVYLTFGIVLESLHGFKLGWYLDVGQEVRRQMWTLAHAHGTLTALIQIGFAFTVSRNPNWISGSKTIASRCLMGAGILLPAGFFLGGLIFPEGSGDPGIGILLVPVGAVLLFVAVLLTALQMTRH